MPTHMDVTTNAPARTRPAVAPRQALARLRAESGAVEVRPEPPESPAPAGPVEPDASTDTPAPTALSRTQIVDATEAVLDTHGYDGATIRRIARQLDCAVGSIYRYFRDKRELLSAVTQRRFEPVAELIEAGHPWRDTAAAYVRVALEQPQQYRLMFWLAGSTQRGPAEAPQVVRRLLAGWARQLGDPGDAARRWSQLHGGIMLGQSVDVILSDAPAAAAPMTPAVHPPTAVADRRRDDLTLL
ncbi:MAG: TetR/AcrR family transcriptional regulator [Phycisphaeraceae bacterium]